MHLSMLSPRVEGWEDPGEFDIFMEARVKFPTPRHLLCVKFPPLGRFSRSSKMADMSDSRP